MSTSTDSTGTRRSFLPAAYLQDRTDGGLADIGDVGAHQFIGAQTGRQGGQDQRAVPFDPVTGAVWFGIEVQGAQQGGQAPLGSALGSVLAVLGRPISGIGLAPISSAVYRNVHNTFHVDQHRRIVAASWDSA